jgi:hypothetical protein
MVRPCQVSKTGAPYAFYATPLPGYPDGFPVMLPNLLSEGRLNETLTLLRVATSRAQQCPCQAALIHT